MQALWVCSPRFRVGSTWNKAYFFFQYNTLRNRRQTIRFLVALSRYFESAFIDRPPTMVGTKSAPRASQPDEPLAVVRLEFICLRELRFTRAEFWHTPYAHTMQLVNLLHQTKNPDAVKFDETSRQVRDVLAARRARAAELDKNNVGGEN
jgi:hypothetical protein